MEILCLFRGGKGEDGCGGWIVFEVEVLGGRRDMRGIVEGS